MAFPDNPPTILSTPSDLTLDPRNANRGTARGRQLLRESLRELGGGRSILVDRTGQVIAGNKTLEEARELGLPILVVSTDGGALVVHQRTDLDLVEQPDARRLAYADNRIGELNLEWDETLLAEDRARGIRLDGLFTDDEIERLLVHGLTTGHTDVDEVIAPPDTTTVQVGDFFALGDHRILCGDATRAETVARLLGTERPSLMVTDPPYGVSYDPSWRHALHPDARTAIGRVSHDDRADWHPVWRLFPGDIAYVWHGGLFADVVGRSLKAANFELRAQIIWVKPHLVLSRGAYHWKHEPCWYAVRAGASAAWAGDRTQTTVWEVPNLNPFGGDRTDINEPTGHGTQKPVRLFEIPLLNHTARGAAVFDPFLGSGTAVIAAETTGRRCFGIEIDPRYAQVIIARWERFTGESAVRLSGAEAGRG
jgi:DNA modification methylase